MQPPWWNSVAIIGETSLTHRQVSRETTGETFHGTTWAVPQIVLRNNLSCSTNRSAKRSATIAQGSMPKSVEKRTGASHNNHVIRVYPYRSPHTPFYARHHTGRRPDHHAPHYTCYANAPHAPSRTSPCKCATQTGHTLAAAQTHHTHCYACHRTRTIAHARHHTRSPSHTLAATQAHYTSSSRNPRIVITQPNHTPDHTRTANHTPNHKPNHKRQPPPTPSKIPIHPHFL